ncbi:zinc metalloprotease [Aurantiacibacter xanthus]|uniref:Zinc metalloprotease n=1 Tax=Aurantiacibacter xanthus TaxID=1784712 RepID=A0A3A1PC90_9SPHN|nr:neutral zinc metallopeptidase [Aurantiacibacter xanthus]RIV91161.1 zinc metalloprotease [Aurantiacibacter xanthus]
MKLNPFDPSKINVRRGGGGGGGMPGGKLGCGGIVVVLIGVFVFGMDPAQMLGTVEQMQGAGQQQQSDPANPNASVADVCGDSQYATEACNALASLDQTWQARFTEEGLGDRFVKPTLELYTGGTRTACGAGSASMGPFYCPGDQTIYIDTSFYDTLERQLGAGGDFARYYVIAHEYGHHIQTITGISGQIRSAQQSDPRNANRYQVLMELQADCYAGVWAGLNRNAIEPGDFEEGMTAASSIGDDALTGGRVSEENFTHGTSQQRMEALRLGLTTGDDRRCDEIVQVR